LQVRKSNFYIIYSEQKLQKLSSIIIFNIGQKSISYWAFYTEQKSYFYQANIHFIWSIQFAPNKKYFKLSGVKPY